MRNGWQTDEKPAPIPLFFIKINQYKLIGDVVKKTIA
jgi:hypothetical protein